MNDTSLEIGDVEIVGTVFGGGEARIKLEDEAKAKLRRR